MPRRRNGVLHGSGVVLLSENGNRKPQKWPNFPLVSGPVWDADVSSIPRRLRRSTNCYGRSTVVSDVDVEGVVLNVDGGSRQELDYVEVRTTEQRDKHTRGDDEKAGTLQSMPTVTITRRKTLDSAVMTTRAKEYH
jgi:hypothetical protein